MPHADAAAALDSGSAVPLCLSGVAAVPEGSTGLPYPHGWVVPLRVTRASLVGFSYTTSPSLPGMTWRLLNSAGLVVAEGSDTGPSVATNFNLPAGIFWMWFTTDAQEGVGMNSHPVAQDATYKFFGACAAYTGPPTPALTPRPTPTPHPTPHPTPSPTPAPHPTPVPVQTPPDSSSTLPLILVGGAIGVGAVVVISHKRSTNARIPARRL